MRAAPCPPPADRSQATPEISHRLIGLLWTIDDVLDLMEGRRNRQHVHAMVARGELLEVRASDGWALYPVFRFDWDDVHTTTRAALRYFRSAPVDGWAIATWFSQPATELGGRSPRAWIYDRQLNDEIAIQLAADTAARWSTP